MPGGDFFVAELLADHRGKEVKPVSTPAEAPPFLVGVVNAADACIDRGSAGRGW